jgi:hypothetical protein
MEITMEKVNEKNIFQYGMLIAIKAGGYEGRKKMSAEQLRELPKEIVRGVHDLYDKPFKKLLQEADKIVMEARDEVLKYCIPFPIGGIYFLPTNKIERAIQFLDTKKLEREEVVEKILANYEGAVQDFAEKYPDYYEASKNYYPSIEKLKGKFHFSYQFFQISSPDKNKSISPEQYKAEQEKFREMITEMKNEVRSTIYQSLIETTEKLKKQCENGKPNQRTFNSLNKFLEKIDDIYSEFIDGKDMEEMLEKIRAEILGIDAEDLRNSEDLRNKFKNTLNTIGEDLKALPDIPLKRAIDF